jgi:Ca2+-transporting ATPase
MRRAPRRPDSPIFAGWTVLHAIGQGAGGLVAVLAAAAWAVAALPEPAARAFTFATLIATNLAQIFTNRSHSRSALAALATPNAVLWSVAAAALGLLALLIGTASVIGFELLKWRRRLAPAAPVETA